jgi:hypothetical protein
VLRPLYRALAPALWAGAFVADLVGVLTLEGRLYVLGFGLLALGLGVGHAVAFFELLLVAGARRAGRLSPRAWLSPAIRLTCVTLAFVALYLHPLRPEALPTASMALSVVATGVWVMLDQLQAELFKRAPIPDRPSRTIRIVVSRR